MDNAIVGNFEVINRGKKYKPGNPMHQDPFPMGFCLGGNIMFLYHQHENITEFNIVNMNTGDTLEVRVPKLELDVKNIWDQLTLSERAILESFLKNDQKIRAIQFVRSQLSLGLKEAKTFIDSDWVWAQFS